MGSEKPGCLIPGGQPTCLRAKHRFSAIKQNERGNFVAWPDLGLQNAGRTLHLRMFEVEIHTPRSQKWQEEAWPSKKSQQNRDLGPRKLLIKKQIIFKGKLYLTFMKKLFTLLFKLHKLLQWSYSVSGCFFGTVPWLSVSKAVAMHCSSWIWKPSNSYSAAVEKNPKNSQTFLISKDTSDPGNVF